MASPSDSARFAAFAPQLLVDDLKRSIAFYTGLGFTFGETWGGFYAIGKRDGLDLHLKCAPKTVADRAHRREHEHLDMYAAVKGIDAFYQRCLDLGVTIRKPLAATPWGTRDFYLEDPDGYIIGAGEG